MTQSPSDSVELLPELNTTRSSDVNVDSNEFIRSVAKKLQDVYDLDRLKLITQVCVEGGTLRYISPWYISLWYTESRVPHCQA